MNRSINPNYSDLRRAAYEANLRLNELGLVRFTFGNVSAADHALGVFAIKPSGVPYKDLSVDAMVVVDFEGRLLDGDLRPSSDTPTHALLYKHWPEVGGIAHTHSIYATALAQTLLDPVLGTTHADHIPTDVPCAPPMDDEMIKRNYEKETANQILQCLKDRGLSYREVEMILVGGHAPFSWGADCHRAVYNSAVLETIAELACLTRQIRPDGPRLKPAIIQKHYERKHGPDAYYGQGQQPA